MHYILRINVSHVYILKLLGELGYPKSIMFSISLKDEEDITFNRETMLEFKEQIYTDLAISKSTSWQNPLERNQMEAYHTINNYYNKFRSFEQRHRRSKVDKFNDMLERLIHLGVSDDILYSLTPSAAKVEVEYDIDSYNLEKLKSLVELDKELYDQL